MGNDAVLIVGGGIGGTATALMLAKQGIKVVVLEEAAELKEIGAGLQLAPNITRILRQMNVLSAIMPYAVTPRRIRFMNAQNGVELTVLDLEDISRRYGGPYIVIHRADLLDTLRAAAEDNPNVAFMFNHAVAEIADVGDEVRVTCTNGEVIRGQLLLGADGINSRVRRELIMDAPVPSGCVAYRGIIPIEDVDVTSANMGDTLVWLGPGLHMVQYPVRAGTLYNQVAVFRSKLFLRGEDDWGTPEELDRAFAGTTDHIRRAIPAIQRSRRWPMYDRNPIASWSNGRIAVLGDAAHAMLQYLAQGAGQSLLDAATLAQTLPSLGPAPWPRAAAQRALQDYSDQRSHFAGRVQEASRLVGDVWHIDSPTGILLRDELFRSRDTYDYKYIEWLYGAGVNDEIKLADRSSA